MHTAKYRKYFMKQHLYRLGLISTVLSFALISGSAVLALPAQATAHAQSLSPSQTITTQQEVEGEGSGKTSNAKPANAGSQGATRLDAAQLKICLKHEKVITNLLSRLSDRGQKQFTLFTTIATRTENFYNNKGKTLSNYDALLADLGAKRDVAQTAVDNLKASSLNFNCGANDPKGVASSFKDSLKNEISALKDYKTSVKNLIVGVKSVQAPTTTTDTKAKGSN
jgi:hypothetical protein